MDVCETVVWRLIQDEHGEMDGPRLTLLAPQQPLDALDELVAMAVGVDPDLLQLLVAHVCQHVQRDLRREMEEMHTDTERRPQRQRDAQTETERNRSS